MKTLARVLQRLRRRTLHQSEEFRNDGELLEAYLRQRDATAFAALVDRHGPMVLGVCNRVLRNDADAEDAFQATFLVLVRKASGIRPREMVGNWLYGVAHRTAWKARATICKRRHKEREAAVTTKTEPGKPDVEQIQWLEGALQQLPDKYRAPLLLCSLEGKTIQEAAHLLGWPQGTVASRITRGREMLSKRLQRQGACLGATLLPSGSAMATLPTVLATKTAQTAEQLLHGTQMAAPHVAQLAEGVIQSMNASKWIWAMATVAACTVCGLTLAAWNSVAHTTNRPPAASTSTQAINNKLTTIEQQRAVNEAVWKKSYLPFQEGFLEGSRGKWLAIVAGQIVPAEEGGRIRPVSTLAEADAAARKVAHNAKHRFIFQIGTEGDVTHQLGASGESNRMGSAFLPPGLTNYRIGPLGEVLFEVENKWHRVGVSGPHPNAPYVQPRLNAPLATQGREQKMFFATGIDAVAVVTSQVATVLELEKWEIPGQAKLGGVPQPCRRAYLRFRWQDPKIDATMPIVIWDGFVPPPQEKPPAGIDLTLPIEIQRLQGTWQVQEYYDDGKPKSADTVRKYKVIITNETFQLRDGSQVRIEAKYTLDPTKKPKSIDLQHLSNDRKGKTTQGIYELNGDELKICYPEHAVGVRSTAFESKSDSPNDILMVLKRVKS